MTYHIPEKPDAIRSPERLPVAALADPKAFAKPARILDLYEYLREHDPMAYIEADGYRPFYAATRAEDIRAIETQSELYKASPRTVLLPIKVEEFYRRTFDDANGVRPLTHMDDAYHRAHRAVTLDWFKPATMKAFQPKMQRIANKYVEKFARSGGQIDFAADIAYWYPLEVVLSLMGVPEQDNPYVLLLTQRLLSPSDRGLSKGIDVPALSPAAQKTYGQHGKDAVSEFAAYFDQLASERRNRPREDIISTIANSEVLGGPMAPHDMTSYFIILATAGHDSTAASISAGLEALIENPEEWAKLKRSDQLYASFADECVRWSTPVKHFMRTPNQDVEWHGQTISSGEAIMLCYGSASRDPAVIDVPNTFKVDRESSAPHLSFGVGPHLCLGRLLAKLEIQCLFRPLLSRLRSAEISAPPTFVESTFVSGHKSLPISFELSV